MRPYKSMLALLVFITLISEVRSPLTSSALVSLFANAAQSDKSTVHTSREIEIRLSVLKRSYFYKRPVMIRVEIQNVGRERLFIPSEIGGGYSYLQFWWKDPKGNDLPGSAGALDGWGPSHEDFTKMLMKNWIVLPPGYSYGTSTNAAIDVDEPRPGRYQVRAKYSVSDMGSKSMDNPLGAYLDKIPSLPFPAWKGAVESNSLSIEIVPDPAEVN